jgi:anaerobic magnesium-protoporphyrin IX monomethyl ester cyclase
MKILLVNPPRNNLMRFRGVNKHMQFIDEYAPPQGLMYIKSYLKKYSNDDVYLYNFQTPNMPTLDDFKKLLLSLQPNVIGITVTTFLWYDIANLTALIREVLGSTVLIVGGGPHMWLYPYESLTYGNFDIVVQGEGEKVFLDIINRIKSKKNLAGIKGVLFKNNNGEIIKGDEPEFIENLDMLPFPDYSGVSLEQHKLITNNKLPAAMILSSRGCKYNCSFCFNHSKKVRTRSSRNVVDEIIERKKEGFKYIYFTDANITCYKEHIKELCEEMINRDVNLPWSCNARVNEVDSEIIGLMSKAGCQQMSFGIESGNQHILNVLNKGIRLEQAEKAMSLARQAGITTIGLFMIGMPNETIDDAMETIHFAKKINPDYANYFAFMPFPGTQLFYDALKDPSFGDDYYRNLIIRPEPNSVIKIWPTKMSEKEIFHLQKIFYFQFYFRISKIVQLFRQINNFTDFFKKALFALKIIWQKQ